MTIQFLPLWTFCASMRVWFKCLIKPNLMICSKIAFLDPADDLEVSKKLGTCLESGWMWLQSKSSNPLPSSHSTVRISLGMRTSGQLTQSWIPLKMEHWSSIFNPNCMAMKRHIKLGLSWYCIFSLTEIVFCDVKMINFLSAALAKIKLALFNIESTAEYVSFWQKMMTFFQVYNQVPVNAIMLLLEKYAKCLDPGFCQHFAMLVSIKHPIFDSVHSILIESQNTKVKVTQIPPRSKVPFSLVQKGEARRQFKSRKGQRKGQETNKWLQW